jgi:hypothetical protein
MVRGSNPGGEIFHTNPDPSWGPPGLLYSAYQVSFLGVQRLGCHVDLPPPFSAEVKERIELYLYSPSGPKSEFNHILIYVCIFKYFCGEHIVQTVIQQTGVTAVRCTECGTCCANSNTANRSDFCTVYRMWHVLCKQ